MTTVRFLSSLRPMEMEKRLSPSSDTQDDTAEPQEMPMHLIFFSLGIIVGSCRSSVTPPTPSQPYSGLPMAYTLPETDTNISNI